uniref:Uncharacterized protein n=1 Tax=viral metagenome TaxID=1070528 RepID=A0A6C0DNG6_9ZZZZ
MQSIQYVMANIKIPIQIDTKGKTAPLMEYISIAIEKCDALPQKSVENIKDISIIDLINSALLDTTSYQSAPHMSIEATEPVSEDEDKIDEKEDPVHKPLSVSKLELETKKRGRVRQNTTFKHKHRAFSRYSVKNHS